jgi:glycosyltransferase XagB
MGVTPPRGGPGRSSVAEAFPFFHLDPATINRDVGRLLDGATARAFRAVVVRVEGDRALVAFAHPTKRAIETVGAMLGREVQPLVADRAAIDAAQFKVYGAPPRTTGLRERRRRREEDERSARQIAAPPAESPPSADRTTAGMLGYDLCHALGVLPLRADSHTVTLAATDPGDPLAERIVRTVTGRAPRWVTTTEAELASALDAAFEREAPAKTLEAEPEAAEPEPAAAPDTAEAADAAEAEAPEPAPAPRRPRREREPARHRHLGEMLVTRGLVTTEQVDEALEIQQRTGDRMGQILMHVGNLSDEAVASALAEQARLTEVDLDTIRPEQRAVELLPEGVIRRHQVVPLEIVDDTLVIAMVDRADADALAAIREHVSMPLRIMLAPASAIDRLLHRVYGEQYVRNAVQELVETAPEESAHFVLSRGQVIFGVGLLLAILVFGVITPVQTIVAISIFAVFFYLAFGIYRFWLVYRSIEHDLHLPVSDEDVAALSERTLPVYTILVPLYKEAAIIPHLVDSIEKLDYPPTKLDVKLLLEEDDEESVAAVAEMNLPPQFQAIVVPHAHPKTKPKACNYGLPHARGEMVVIFDAEDEPEPDQLKKVVASLRNAADPQIVCVQARLNYYNPNQNLLTRWFTTEYSMWFDLFLPGLDATDVPIPLGGTSNHFVREKLEELGGWDPFNVTEDADLGVRLYRHGYRVAVVDSTTYEEANSEVRNWVRQRSRWVKGYIQTWLVQMRHPLKLMRAIGPRRWLSFQLVVGGTFLVFLLNPIFWTLTSLWTLTEAGVLRQIFPGVVYYAGGFALYLGNFLFAYVTAAGAAYRGYNHLVKYALLVPLYWALMSVAAWKGLIQLVRKPFYWEKTEHGLHLKEEGWDERPKRAG